MTTFTSFLTTPALSFTTANVPADGFETPLPAPALPADDNTALPLLNLNAIGYDKAAQHRGNALALDNLLNRVLRGYLVDEGNGSDRRQQHEKRTDEQLLALDKQAEQARTRIRQINASELPAVQEQLAAIDDEILEIRRAEAAGMRHPDHLDRTKLRLYGWVTVLATLFVYLFYVSSFYSAFYRDIASEMQAAGTNGQTGVLSAIFARQAFLVPDFHWFGPLLLFAFGVMLHALSDQKSRWARVGLVVLFGLILVTDGLIAYFVENKVHDMKLMMGMANEADAHHCWTEPVFWLVMAMGFGAAMIWSGLLHAWMHEVGKKDVARLTALDIRHRQEKQWPLKARITDLKAQLAELDGQINQIGLDVKALREGRQAVVFSPSELEKYVTDFYDGWLTYVNNRMGPDTLLRAECDGVMRAFRVQHLAGVNTSTTVPVADSLSVANQAGLVRSAVVTLGLVTALLTATASVSLATVPPVRTTNYVVLLDLSDRVLAPEQARRDIALIQTVFAQFEQRVRQQQLVFANDCFRVVIAPQKGLTYRPESFMDALYLDMATLPMADKRKRLDALRADLPRQLGRLYAGATAGKHHSRDFAGCDLWQYVNEQLPTDLKPDADNRLVILTDGYLDFEANPRALRQGNRATDSRMLDRLRHDPHWRQTLAQPTEGLLPVQKQLPKLSVCVAEVRAKFDNLNEADLLTALWDKWLRELRAVRWAVQVQGSLPKSQAMLQAFLTN